MSDFKLFSVLISATVIFKLLAIFHKESPNLTLYVLLELLALCELEDELDDFELELELEPELDDFELELELEPELEPVFFALPLMTSFCPG